MLRFPRQALAPLLIVLGALIYYGIYFRCGFNVADEGSAALLAQRLLAGELPIRDLALGYNVLWFYPITGLFALFGPHLLAMRAWFFFLQTTTALFAFFTLRRVSGKGWPGFLVAGLLILIPGPQHKAYIPLLVMANGWALTRLILAPPGVKALVRLAAAGGLALGAALLIRIDLGIFLSVLWIGALALRLSGRDWRGQRVAGVFGSFAALAAVVLLVHAPVYLDAKRRGFGDEFTDQYPAYAGYIRYALTEAMRPKPTPVAAPAVPAASAVAEPAAPTQPEASRETLARRPLSDAWKKKQWKQRAWPFLTYAPVAGSLLLLAATALHFAAALRKKQLQLIPSCLAMLTLLGAALVDFPQFFFFRPDVPHLAEFMPGFFVALAGSLALAVVHRGLAGPLTRLAWSLVAAFSAVHLALYVAVVFPRASAGTAAIGAGRTELFQGGNGVHVLLTPRECAAFRAMHAIILQSAAPGEFVVCYPYAPGVNFMTNRPTYERSVFIDNATRGPAFDAETIAKIERFHPAVIAIDDWKINRADDSSFSRWAAPTKAYIAQHFHYRGTYERQQIYTRNPPAP